MDYAGDAAEELVDEHESVFDILADLRDWALECRHRDRAIVYFYDLVDRGFALPNEERVDLLDPVYDTGLLTREEHQDVLFADLLVPGRRWDNREDQYLVVEVAVEIGVTDVQRAHGGPNCSAGSIPPSLSSRANVSCPKPPGKPKSSESAA